MKEAVSATVKAPHEERMTDTELAEVARLILVLNDPSTPVVEDADATEDLVLLAGKMAAELARWRAPVDVETETERRRQEIVDAREDAFPMLRDLFRPHVTREAALAREVASLRAERDGLQHDVEAFREMASSNAEMLKKACAFGDAWKRLAKAYESARTTPSVAAEHEIADAIAALRALGENPDGGA